MNEFKINRSLFECCSKAEYLGYFFIFPAFKRLGKISEDLRPSEIELRGNRGFYNRQLHISEQTELRPSCTLGLMST